jgi:hypothetical protein
MDLNFVLKKRSTYTESVINMVLVYKVIVEGASEPSGKTFEKPYESAVV